MSIQSIFFLFGSLFFLPTMSDAQWQRAYLNEDGAMRVEEVPAPAHGHSRDGDFEQLPGFPKGFPANPSFKNFRNLTLADLEGDGVAEILMASYNKLRVFRNDTLLWEKTLSGTAIYPPSVADVNQDGLPEIVQATGGVPAAGRLYLLNHLGEDLPGWPLNFNNNWILSAPALADLDGDDVMEIVFSERVAPAGNVHIVKLDGSPFNENWPVALDATPAVTPSIGDVDRDGEKDIVINSTTTRYIFGLDGQPKPGFPLVTHPFQRYSYQSPILVDLDEEETLEIVGATHGDNVMPAPQFYVMEAEGADFPGWPIAVPDNNWTYSTPTVIKMGEEYHIFMSRPIGEEEDDMLYGWDASGNLLPGFPIVKSGGLEGIITVADVDNDDELELIFGSNLLGGDGNGFIHAYEMDGSGQTPGFPICPRGWTFINGANPGDVNGDGLMDLSILTYTQNFGAAPDSVFLNVYDLGVPYSPEKIAWGAYKGSNTRDGLVAAAVPSALNHRPSPVFRAELRPNPAGDFSELSLQLAQEADLNIQLQDAHGRQITPLYQGKMPAGSHQLEVPMNNLPAGLFFISIQARDGSVVTRKLIKN